MNLDLDAYLAAIAKKYGLRGTDVAAQQEMIRLLWNYVWLMSEMDPGDLEDDRQMCADVVSGAITTLEKIDELIRCAREQQFSPNEKGTC